MDLEDFVNSQMKALSHINSPSWRAPGEAKWLSGDEVEKQHFKPQRKATRNIIMSTVNQIFNCSTNDPLLPEVLKTISESRWKLHFQMAFYKAKKRLELAELY